MCGGEGTWRFLANCATQMANICAVARLRAEWVIYRSWDKGRRQWRS